MQTVNVVPPMPVINPWIRYSGMKTEQQNEFLGGLLREGRLSRTPKENFVVLSDRETDSGLFFNPFFIDGTILYFVNEKDVIDFVNERQARLNRNFSYYRLRGGKCQH